MKAQQHPLLAVNPLWWTHLLFLVMFKRRIFFFFFASQIFQTAARCLRCSLDWKDQDWKHTSQDKICCQLTCWERLQLPPCFEERSSLIARLHERFLKSLPSHACQQCVDDSYASAQMPVKKNLLTRAQAYMSCLFFVCHLDTELLTFTNVYLMKSHIS